MGKIIGRKEQIIDLDNYMKSGRAEFIAIYGRRRIGKTYLVRQYFDNNFAFSTSGILESSLFKASFLISLTAKNTIVAKNIQGSAILSKTHILLFVKNKATSSRIVAAKKQKSVVLSIFICLVTLIPVST